MRLIALDLIRFVSALAVVLYHYTARSDSISFPVLQDFTKFGYLGVPIFFIISGYVITLSAKNKSPSEFAISRFVRLYPTYWIGVLFTAFFVFWIGRNDNSLIQVIANLTMINSYFGYGDIEGVYWTLLAELKFYACIYILILFKVFDKIRIWLSIWLSITFLHLVYQQPFFMGWFISPEYSSFFIAGIAFHLINKEGNNRFNLFILSSSLVISSIQIFKQTSNYIPNPDAIDLSISITLIWGFYLLFYIIIKEKISIVKRKLYLILGGITYPLYLIHNMAGKAIIDNVLNNLPDWLAVSITIILMLILSFIIHTVFEKRMSNPIKVKLFYLRDKIIKHSKLKKA